MPHQVIYFDRTREEPCPYDEDLMINPTIEVQCDMVVVMPDHISFQHYEGTKKVAKTVPLADLYELYLYMPDGALIGS